MSTMHGVVEQVERLSPSMIRFVFGGDGLATFTPTGFTDEYVNALFIPDGAPYEAPFDVDEARSLDAGWRPRGRRYTVRRWDDAQRRLTVDFVAHDDTGLAGRWAQHAEVGDTLQMIGPSGGYRPDPDSDHHLFVGDESALPAIAASLEAARPGAQGTVVAVVDGPNDEIALPDRPGIAIRWCHRAAAPDPETVLVDAVAALEWPAGHVDVFVHGEASEVRAVRRHLLAERGVSKEASSISPYWRRNHDDEAWRAVKREWLVAQAADV